ncbi:CREB-regulated transcription coactivator 2-like [Patiria miniata]|uniref:Homeobox domain-containing protein n=1 Tax=Patiria miniata TaxID=46514 RepID=A0A914BAH3_PATMI|nr:CREB-regulated transcription coactivator 2-like [Patiria miniata]
MSSPNIYQPLNLCLKDGIGYEMRTTQENTASSMAGGKELCSRENESPVAADLGFLLDSAETQILVRELMSDASLLAQVNGLMSEADGREVSTDSPKSPEAVSPSDGSSPVPSLRESGSEYPRQQPGSPMEAHAPFTPTVVSVTMRQDASHVHPPTGPAQTPLNHSQHDVQGGHPYAPSVHQTPPQPYQCQPPLPTKRGFLGNKRKPKTNFTSEQLELLEMTFAHSHYPSSVLRNQLSYVSRLPLKAIQTWFQNRRVRFKRKCGKSTKQSRQSSSSDSGFSESSCFSRPVTARPSPNYVLVFPQTKAESSQQAGQFPRDGHQQSSPPNYQGVDCGYRFHSQFAGRPFPDQTAPSRDWYQRQQPMGVLPSRWGAVSPWPLTNAGSLDHPRPSNDNLPMRGGQQHWASPMAVKPSHHNWETISPKLPELSMMSNRQHLVEQPVTASPRQPPEGAMLPQDQPSHNLNFHQPSTSSWMMQNQFSFQCASPKQQISDLNWMHPQNTPYPQEIQRFAAPNATPQVGFSAAFPQQELQSDNIRNFQDNHSCPMPKSAPQPGYSDNYPTKTLLSRHYSDSYPHHQVNLPSFPSFPSTHSWTSNQSYSECPTSLDNPPCSSPDEEPVTPPTDISVTQGASTLNDTTPAMQCQFLPPATPPFTPGVAVALYGDSQPCGQFPTQPLATPRELFRACDNPLMPPTDEPLESPSTPLSACSFASCKTLYIDLDAEID